MMLMRVGRCVCVSFETVIFSFSMFQQAKKIHCLNFKMNVINNDDTFIKTKTKKKKCIKQLKLIVDIERNL